MVFLSNFLSILRVPLALVFLINNSTYRAFSILLAMITDSLDGFLARRFQATTQFGAALDPVMDKFFVIFALGIFITEGRLNLLEASTMLCRDFAVLVFGIYLALRGYWGEYQFRSIWSGKITTTLQFFVLLALTFSIDIPTYFYLIFVILGILALIELYLLNKEMRNEPK